MRNLLSVLLIVVVSVGLVFAQNTSEVSQNGTGNINSVDQLGWLNYSKILQDGTGNDAFLKQEGISHSSTITQAALTDYNDANVFQFGLDHISNLTQTGFGGNYAEVIQHDGYVEGNQSDVYSYGLLNSVVVHQQDNSQYSSVVQNGWSEHSSATVYQKGWDQNSVIEQTYDYNTAIVNQDGANHSSNIDQTGFLYTPPGNLADVFQRGLHQTSQIFQNGENIAGVIQTDWDNYSFIDQNSLGSTDENEAYVDQDGWKHSSKIYQTGQFHDADVLQRDKFNSSTITQLNYDNDAWVQQYDKLNESVIWQDGVSNDAYVWQYGQPLTGETFNNFSLIEQSGDYGFADVRQYDRQNYSRVTQYGISSNEKATVLQYDDIFGFGQNSSQIDQWGTSEESWVRQDGALNASVIVQGPGTDNELVIDQFYLGNYSYADQYGDNNFGDVKQVGTGNSSTLYQGYYPNFDTGNGNDAFIDQNGIGNDSDVYQVGDLGLVDVTQLGLFNTSVILQDGTGNSSVVVQVTP